MAMAMAMAIMVTLALFTGSGASATSARPNPSDSPAMARWLVSQSDWGVLSTISIHLKGMPWGNVASFSDGPVGTSKGTPYFYLSKMDPTPNDIESDPRCSLSLSEAPLGSCGGVDTENPTCARLTLSGKMQEVTDTQELDFASQALFSKHPEMPDWPKGHKWVFYKLEIADIFLIDYYGGAKPITVDEYYRGSVKAAVAR
ncbi:hypothetical protein KC19_2G026800 [Ceratodon purpureus]|uniref:CREG-like beta-barrel domain-containing protein n=2 Tax=Ceratodon purpureus TaxID=3225 RepID=A0A8T0IRG0_CERPU|nr:hypothetical protein KC19_2G026800 [Ceratodon purpureus]